MDACCQRFDRGCFAHARGLFRLDGHKQSDEDEAGNRIRHEDRRSALKHRDHQAAERRAEARATARAAAESVAADALRSRISAAASFSADAARSADAAGRADEVHRTLSELRGRMPRRFAWWVPAAVMVALAIGYLWGSRPQGNAPLAEPLQLRLEHSLVTYKP